MGGLINRISPISEWASQSSLFSFNLKAGYYGQLICFYLPNSSSFPSVHKAWSILPHWNEYRNYTGYCSRTRNRFLSIIKGVSKETSDSWPLTDWYSLSPVFLLPFHVGIQSAFLQYDKKDTCGNCAKVEANDIHPFPIVCKARNNTTEGSKLCQTAWPW